MQKDNGVNQKDYTAKTEIKPSTFLNPIPAVMVSCSSGDIDDIVTVAWAGTVCSDPPMVSISLRKTRLSHKLISESRKFVINLVSEDLVEALDYCGVKSGRDTDKFKDMKLSKNKSDGFLGISDSPVNICCEVTEIKELGSHDMFLATVVSVSVADYLMDRDYKIDLRKAKLVSYIHGEYFTVGKILGYFGFSVASAKTRKKRPIK